MTIPEDATRRDTWRLTEGRVNTLARVVADEALDHGPESTLVVVFLEKYREAVLAERAAWRAYQDLHPELRRPLGLSA